MSFNHATSGKIEPSSYADAIPRDDFAEAGISVKEGFDRMEGWRPDPMPDVRRGRLWDGREIRVVRDDLLPGGAKQRFADPFVAGKEGPWFYAQPKQGFAGIALAHLGRKYKQEVHLFCPSSKAGPTPHQRLAAAAGAELSYHIIGGLGSLRGKCRMAIEKLGRGTQFPMGLRDWSVVVAIAMTARLIKPTPKEVWCVGSTGVMTRGLQLAWPDAQHHVVEVARDMGGDAGTAQVWTHYLPFNRPTLVLPPFPSVSTYDAKAWEIINERAADGALFWNVAADVQP